MLVNRILDKLILMKDKKLTEDDVSETSRVLSEFLNKHPCKAVKGCIEEFFSEFVSENTDFN